jgi:hypothetical protein
MKKEYIKPCVCFDTFEVKANILEMSFGGEEGPGKGEARQRDSNEWASNTKNGQRGYGSYGSRNTGWGSLW